jgi:hypothetical protein
MPIAGEEFVFEMTINCLLMPKAGGVPTWQSNEVGELATMKLPRQFEQLFEERTPLSEDHGETMARWAEGGAASRFEQLVAEIKGADPVALEAVVSKIEEAKRERSVNPSEFKALRTAFASRKKALAATDSAGPMDEVQESVSP